MHELIINLKKYGFDHKLSRPEIAFAAGGFRVAAFGGR
jgi:hypothetical protein